MNRSSSVVLATIVGWLLACSSLTPDPISIELATSVTDQLSDPAFLEGTNWIQDVGHQTDEDKNQIGRTMAAVAKLHAAAAAGDDAGLVKQLASAWQGAVWIEAIRFDLATEASELVIEDGVPAEGAPPSEHLQAFERAQADKERATALRQQVDNAVDKLVASGDENAASIITAMATDIYKSPNTGRVLGRTRLEALLAAMPDGTSKTAAAAAVKTEVNRVGAGEGE